MSQIINAVKYDLEQREERGLSKYGTTVDRTDLTQKEWLQHAYEEALDMAVYLKKLISEEREGYKFKVGDKVRVARINNSDKINWIGKELVIYEFYQEEKALPKPAYRVDRGILFWYEDELELIEE